MTLQSGNRTLRTLALTDAARATILNEAPVTPSDLFTDKQLAAIDGAGYSVFFVDATPLLGGGPS